MKIKNNQTRLFNLEPMDNERAENKNYISFSLSSETPVRREYGDEILLHGPENVDMSRAIPNGLPLLVAHNDTMLPIGRLKNIRLEGRKLRGDAYFSGREEAQAVRQDVLDGIVTDLSVGYRILDYRVEKAQSASDVNKVFITRWMPREGSACASGADSTVGFGRSEESTEIELDLNKTDERQAPINAESAPTADDPAIVEEPRVDPPADAVEEAVEAAEETSEGEAETCPDCGKPMAECTCEDRACGNDKKRSETELINEECAALRKVALNMNVRSEAEVDRILAENQDLEKARAILLNPPPKPNITFVRNNMSINAKFMQALTNAVRGDFQFDEAVQGSFNRTGERSFKADLFNTLGTRTNEMTTSDGGDQTIYAQNIGFLDLLRARTVVLKAGARTKQGSGNMSYIRQKAASTAALRAELGSVSNSMADFEKVGYTPKAITAKIVLTDELQKTSAIDLQAVLKADIIKQFALALDQYALVGAASPVSLVGLLSASSGIYDGDLDSAAPATWANVNALKGMIDAKAVDLTNLTYLVTPAHLAVLEATQKFSNYGGAIAENGKIGGSNVFSSAHVPVTQVGSPATDNHTMLLGDFSNLELALFGPTEFDLNTSTYFAEGLTILSARQYFDIGILQPLAFAKCANYELA